MKDSLEVWEFWLTKTSDPVGINQKQKQVMNHASYYFMLLGKREKEKKKLVAYLTAEQDDMIHCPVSGRN